MRQVFLDTSHLLATLSPRDNLHATSNHIAAELTLDRSVTFCTTMLVLAELLASLSGGGSRIRTNAADFVTSLQRNKRVLVERLTPELFDAGLRFYRARPDKAYSLTDCVSMVLCRERGISDVLTGDRDFEQEGFIALLRVRR